jgi:hypothetical protein
MRPLLLTLTAALAVIVAACGGGAAATGAADVQTGSPIVSSYAGKPLAIVFFHPY